MNKDIDQAIRIMKILTLIEDNTLDYDVPRHYSQGGENMRTAKKKSNLVTKELEERIRKAPGVASQDQIGVVQG